MRMLKIKVPLARRGEPVYLAPISDTHLGDHGCDRPWLEKWLRLCRGAAACGVKVLTPWLGDNGDMIGKQDRRHCGTARHNEIGEQVRDVAELIAITSETTPFVLFGNHEHSVARKGDVDPHKLLGDYVGLTDDEEWVYGSSEAPVDGSMSVLVRLTTEHSQHRRSRLVYFHHGYFGGSRPNRVRRLMRLQQHWDADLIVVGHGHEGVDTGPIGRPRPNPSHTEVKVHEARGVMCSTWVKPWVTDIGHDESCSYSELRGYDSHPHGPTLIKLTPRGTQVFFGEAAEEELSNAG